MVGFGSIVDGRFIFYMEIQELSKSELILSSTCAIYY